MNTRTFITISNNTARRTAFVSGWLGVVLFAVGQTRSQEPTISDSQSPITTQPSKSQPAVPEPTLSEVTPSEAIPSTATPNDLLFESIRKELTVAPPTFAPPAVLPNTTEQSGNREGEVFNEQTWLAIELLVRSARILESQATLEDNRGGFKRAMEYRAKIKSIRLVVQELLK